VPAQLHPPHPWMFVRQEPTHGPLLKSELPLLLVVSFRKGVKECKSCLREITDPAELPCHHIFCTSCILEWVNKQCKICKEEFPEDYTPTASEATRYLGAGKKPACLQRLSR